MVRMDCVHFTGAVNCAIKLFWMILGFVSAVAVAFWTIGQRGAEKEVSAMAAAKRARAGSINGE